MNASRPEAETEYSTGDRARSGLLAVWWAAGGPTIVGAIALLVAELAPLERIVTVAGHPALVRTVATGPHDGWGLVPIAALALLFAWISRAGPHPRAACLGIAVLGLVALALALLVDRRDIHAVGAADVARILHPAQVRAGVGLYLETLGGALLVVGGVAGALLAPGRSRPANGGATHRQQTRD